MTANDLIAAFETLADAPDGVKRLRELVLQLAVRGKLVAQDPADAKAEIDPDGGGASGRRGKRATRGPAVEPPFDLPDRWRWYQLGEVAHDLGSKEPDQPFTYIDVGAIDNQRGVIGSDLSVVEPSAAPSRARKLIKRGTVIYSTVRPYLLNIAKIDRDFTPEPIVSTAFAVLHPHRGLDYRYLYLTLRSGYFIDYVSTAMKGVAYPAINDAQLMVAPVPVPPLAEQHRIFVRVDELMGLLDRLEATRTTRDDVRRAARDAALAALRDAEDTDAVEAAWGRIAGQMDALFAEPDDVGPLRDVILDLAVGGRLVPQVPGDDPAERLVARSTAEMQRRHLAGLTRIGEDPGGYDRTDPLPGGWCWCSLQRLVQFIDYRGNTPAKVSSGVRLITAKNIRRGFINRQPEEFVTEETYREWMTRGFPQPGDVLFTTEAPMGNAALVDLEGPFALAQRTINLQPYAGVSGAFLVSLFLSPWFQGELTKRATGMTATGIKAAKLRQIRVPVPPLPEQHRIVAKVDALMAICDALEARLTTARDLHGQFAAAAVHHLDV